MGKPSAISQRSSLPDISVSAVLPARVPGRESGFQEIFAPWLDGLPVPQRDLLALLPVLDVNGAIVAALSDAGTSRGGPVTLGARALPVQPGVIAALLCVDPFLRVRDLVALLKAVGVTGVTNFPTIQVIDGVSGLGFESAGLGVQREARMLASFAGEGLAVTGFATTAENGRRLLDHGATALVVHPGPPSTEWRARVIAARSAKVTLQKLRPHCNVPLRLFCPDAYGAELDAARALADGLVRYA